MLRHVKWPIATALCLMSVPAITVAQVNQRQPSRAIPNQAVQQNQPASNGATENHDAFLADWLIIDNNNEIAMAELAAQKAGSDQVKQFAQKMIADHQKLNEQLMRFAGNKAPREESAQRSNPATNEQNRQQAQNNAAPRANQSEPQRRTVARVTDQGEIPGQNSGQARSHGGVLGLKREIADQCLASARKELDGKSGKEFDECYMGMQIGAHMYVVDAMAVFQRHASPELRQVIAAGEQTAEGHLQMAKNFMQHERQDAAQK
jgi:putative membrane protein